MMRPNIFKEIKNSLKAISAVIIVLVAAFFICVGLMDMTRRLSYEFWYRDMVKKTIETELNFRIESLEDYKKTCIKMTTEQHEINMKILEYMKSSNTEKEIIKGLNK